MAQGKLVQARKLANGKVAILVGGKKKCEVANMTQARLQAQKLGATPVKKNPKLGPKRTQIAGYKVDVFNDMFMQPFRAHVISIAPDQEHGREMRRLVANALELEPNQVIVKVKIAKRKNVSSGKTIGRGRTRIFHPFRSSPDYDPSYLHDAEGARARKRAKGGAGKKKKVGKKIKTRKTVKHKPAKKLVLKGSKRSAITRYRSTQNPRLTSNKDLDVEIKRIPLDRQGYTKDGQYFGVGQTLWDWRLYKESTREEEAGEKRAADKADVLSWLKGKYPHMFAKKNPKAKSKKSTGGKRKIPAAFKAAAEKAKAMTRYRSTQNPSFAAGLKPGDAVLIDGKPARVSSIEKTLSSTNVPMRTLYVVMGAGGGGPIKAIGEFSRVDVQLVKKTNPKAKLPNPKGKRKIPAAKRKGK
jgi:hypothetical protein